MACNLLSFQGLQAERRDSIPLRSTMMTYPDDCRAYKAKAESMEGHIRSTPAIGKPKGADRAGAYEPFRPVGIPAGLSLCYTFLRDEQIAVCRAACCRKDSGKSDLWRLDNENRMGRWI